MHHALEIQEILLNILGHCYPPDIAALARTCRAFKEPALDVLWEELHNSSPLAQCLPEASRLSSTNKYSFSRPLTQTEWDILRSYARRIRAMLYFRPGLNWESVTTLWNAPTTEVLFPNLRYLCCMCVTEPTHPLHLPLPSLISLRLAFMSKDLRVFQYFLESFLEFAPNIRRLSISVLQPDVTLSNFFSSYLCRWRSLHAVLCPGVSLDVNSLVHLSRMPALTELAFQPSATLPDQIPSSDLPLVFSNLHNLELHSQSLTPVSRLLSRSRLPVITDLSAFIESCPQASKQDVSSFLASLPTSGIGHTIQGLWLVQTNPSNVWTLKEPNLHLSLEDLQPCMAFSNLRRINFGIECNIHLTKSEVQALTSAWPHFEYLVINYKMIAGHPRTGPEWYRLMMSTAESRQNLWRPSPLSSLVFLDQGLVL